MKSKTALVASTLAIAIGLTSIIAVAAGHRHPTPQRPAPILPTPGQPTFPGFPGDPKPPFPTMPAPGQPNPKGGPEVPFPLSITLPFPWGNIEGMWKVVSDGNSILFSFKVQTDTAGHQFLRVLQIDSNTGALIAEGIGLGVESDKLVRAAMASKSTGSNYMLFIGAYKNTSQQGVGASASLKSVTVITVRPFTALMGDHDVQVIVTKVSNQPYGTTNL